MVYFTSDLHFNHNKIMQYSQAFRNFDNDVEKMNRGLIELWNDTVTSNDDVYNLGDFSLSSSMSRILPIAQKLKGRHHFILGNHDYSIKKKKDELLAMRKDDGNPLFSSIKPYSLRRFEREDGSVVTVALSHYPIFEWEEGQSGSIMLHGHIHDFISPIPGKILNVGYDLHGYLLSLDDVLNYVGHLPNLSHHNKDKCGVNLANTIESRKQWIRNKIVENNRGYEVYAH